MNKEFLKLSKTSKYTMDEIEFWLLKYSDCYKNIYSINCKKEIFEQEDGSNVWLPPTKKLISNSEKKFLNLFEALNTISKFHRNEKYFEQEIIEYHKIKHSKSGLKKWVSKNEDIGADEYVCFLIDYLDYSENAEHLNVYVHSSKELEIFIDRKYFKNTIEFLEIFNEFYWVQEILLENLEGIRTKYPPPTIALLKYYNLN